MTDLSHERTMEFFKDGRVFVLPSRIEPFGIVLLEAGVFGVPVVATRVGGIPEIIEHGVTGMLVDPEDAQALAESLDSLLDDGEAAKVKSAAPERRRSSALYMACCL